MKMSTNQLEKEARRVIDVAVDVETLSRRPDAAIISIAAVPFRKDGAEPPAAEHFFVSVNATTCALSGLHFDMETVRFWEHADKEAKAALQAAPARSLQEAVDGFVAYIERLKRDCGAEVVIWAQGTDFDIPVLKNAILRVSGEAELPWEYRNVRDARTYVEELAETLGEHEWEEVRKDMPKPTLRHSALADCRDMIARIQFVHEHVCAAIG